MKRFSGTIWHRLRSTKILALTWLGWAFTSTGYGQGKGQNPADFCTTIVPAQIQTFEPKLQPSYWITVSPDGHWLSYMTISGNYMIDVSDHSKGSTLKAPGKVDLQFSADGAYFTLVNKHYSQAKRLSFGVEHGTSWYSVPELLSYFDTNLPHNSPVWDGAEHPHQSRKVRRLAIDRTFFNHYHSMAKFTDDQGVSWHRLMNDLKGASFRDYRFDGDQLIYKPVIYITNSAPLIDPYGNSYLDLPMMSRDGKWFAGFNRDTMTTQIFAIDTDQQRRFVLDLGMETGKVAFSYPNPDSPYFYIAYHVDFVIHEEGNKMTGKMIDRSKDIMVVKLKRVQDGNGLETLEKESYTTVTRTGVIGDGNYYPQWSKDDILYYVQVKKSNGANKSYHFIKVPIAQFAFRPYNLPQSFGDDQDSCQGKNFHQLVAIGAFWSRHCSQFWQHLTSQDAAITAMGLGETTCKNLAEAFDAKEVLAMPRLFRRRTPHNRAGGIRPDGRWTQKAGHSQELVAQPAAISQITKEMLIKACQPWEQLQSECSI